MPVSVDPKKERLEARITPEQKSRFKRAAGLTGRSLSEFVVSSVDEAARKTISEMETMRLSTRDREAFVGALLEAPAPNARLRRAAQEYLDTMNG